MPFLINNGTCVTDLETFRGDILIDGEKISAIDARINLHGVDSIDASGKLIMPGGVDPHTHFELPMFGTISSDDHYTGHKAAAFGGTTTVIDFVSQDFPTLQESVDAWHRKADNKAAIDFGFHMNITHWTNEIAEEMASLPDMGIPSVKVFTAYNNRLRLSDREIFQVLRTAGKLGVLTLLHAENGDVIEQLIEDALGAGHTSPEWHARTRPAWSAVEATFRAASLAAQAGAPLYIVHMNAAGEVDQLKYVRDRKAPVMGETCPQYLFFDESYLSRPDGAKWVCSPPLRKQEDQEQLWAGLSDGIIQVIGTDHCPFFYDGTRPIIYENASVTIPGKELGKSNFTKIPNGLPAVGDRLPILWTYGVQTGRITANQFVALTSTNPSKIFGLYPRKGSLTPGADADLVIWDPARQIRYGTAFAHHRTDYNLYEGWDLTGYPEKVFLRGKLIVDKNDWLGSPGSGQFLHRQTHGQIL